MLEGIRVVECGIYHAGPGAGVILADLGAEVIKVEPLNGDPERKVTAGPNKVPMVFEASNRGKKALALDLGNETGRKILDDLLGTADVFITNIRDAAKRRLRLEPASLNESHPRLVHVHVSGFGPMGDMANVGAFDALGQAMSGMMYLADPDLPRLVDFATVDQLTAIVASNAALTGLFARERSGQGQDAYVSLYGSGVWLAQVGLYSQSLLGEEFRSYNSRERMPALRTFYKCSDGRWIMACLNHHEEKHWPALCKAVDRTDLLTDDRFSSAAGRREFNKDLLDVLDATFAQKPSSYWMPVLLEHDLFVSPIQSLADLAAEPQADANGYVRSVDHRRYGSIRVPGYPIQFGSYVSGPPSPAPNLGEHSREILAGLGLDNPEIERLIEDNVVKVDLAENESQVTSHDGDHTKWTQNRGE
jgi:crotonobetainyl-CoA:carnitine CoA-transferase CaiB-like acyl-CoA transferase